MSKKPSPNDDRSIVKNPNNPAFHADQANRQAQGHPDVTPSPPPAEPPAAPPPKVEKP